MPSGDERRIFEPFIHGDAPGSAGIGLALAQALAEAQGARLELRPGTGPGACFVLTLPGATIAAEPESGDRAAAPVARGRSAVSDGETAARGARRGACWWSTTSGRSSAPSPPASARPATR